MRKKLSAELPDHLPAAKTKRNEVRDQLMLGRIVRVSVSGGRVWYLTTAVMDKPRRIKLGTYPVLSVTGARKRAREILRQIQALARLQRPSPKSSQCCGKKWCPGPESNQ